MRLITAILMPCAMTASTLNADENPEIRIVSSVDQMIGIYQEADYWGELEPDRIIEVPPLLVVATIREWRGEAAAISVQDKKELFYRSLLPLVLYANQAIASDRDHPSASHASPVEKISPSPLLILSLCRPNRVATLT